MSEVKPILVVDDDPATCALLQRVLSAEGYKVVIAENGLEAFNLVTLQPFSLIILDMRMPIADGWKFLDMYCDEPPPHIPIVTVSVEPTNFRMMNCANEFFPKPYRLTELLACVQKYVKPDQYFASAAR
jgi:CheY-like chemotaxis protein